MSHYTVTVITETRPDTSIITNALAPFHEFECTGHDDQYVQSINILDEIRKDYDKYLVEEYNECPPGEGFSSLVEFVDGYHGYKVLYDDDEPKADHKYGWYRMRNGEVVEVIRRTNPNSKWDGWNVGGRWRNFFLLKDGNYSSFAKKSDIDIEKMRDVAGEKAGKRWDTIHAVVGDYMESYRLWEDFLAQYEDIDKCRELYRNQAAVKALNASNIDDKYFVNLGDFAISRNEYMENARRSAFQTFAILNADGEWMERGDMGWWACVSNENTEWQSEFDKVIDNVPDHYWLTIVDCHI